MTPTPEQLIEMLEKRDICLVHEGPDSYHCLPLSEFERAALISALRQMCWQPIETAPKGGGAKYVTDPKWVEPPKILLRFGNEAVSVAYWDWYYAEGGHGYRDGFAWIEPCSSEPLNLHYSTPPDGWMPIPSPPPTEGESK